MKKLLSLIIGVTLVVPSFIDVYSYDSHSSTTYNYNTTVVEPYIPHFRYYKYGVIQNKLYKGGKLNTHLVDLVNTIPEAKEQLDIYLKNEKIVVKWSRIGTFIALPIFLTGFYYALSNYDYGNQTKNILVPHYLSNGDVWYWEEPVKYSDSSMRQKYETGLILFGTSLIIGYISISKIFKYGVDQDQNLLNAVNSYNDKSEKKIELIIASDYNDKLGIRLVKRF